MAKFAPVTCELRTCEKDDLEDFIRRREQLTPLGKENKCLERVLAIFDGNDGSEGPFVATLAHTTARSLEQITVEDEVLEPDTVRGMLEDLLSALSLHKIDHGSISKPTIFRDDTGQVYLRGFMRSAKSRRLGQDLQDLFKVFRSLTSPHSDHKFNIYLHEHFNSIEHARDQFPSPDAEFGEIFWSREIYLHRDQSGRLGSSSFFAIGQLCEALLF